MKSLLLLVLFALAVGVFVQCRQQAVLTQAIPQQTDFAKPRNPEWLKNATIYEVNLRQHTPEGTFKSFIPHIKRLKEMGIDVVWFMPIHPISKKERKGSLGSPYAVSDYRAVNPDMGSMADFKAMLDAVHKAGMHLIIDWVPNHTGWDHKWITQHPEWYEQDAKGHIIDPIEPATGKSWGWTDVASLNYDNKEMRAQMIADMKFWIQDIGIDGFRVDVAHNVPVDFWVECSDALFAVKPIFMLAEAEVPDLLNTGSFAADYGWAMHHVFNDIAATQGANTDATAKLVQGNVVEGKKEQILRYATDIDMALARIYKKNKKGFKMHFTSNHDENAWAGTEMMRMGDGHLAFAVLAATFDGIPLIYSGMESGMNKRLNFFEKDNIEWGDYKYAGFYKTLFDLKHRNRALWNGEHGAILAKCMTNNDSNVYVFTREKDGDKVCVIINLSSKPQKFVFDGTGDHPGTYTDVFTGASTTITATQSMSLEPWQYIVLSNR